MQIPLKRGENNSRRKRNGQLQRARSRKYEEDVRVVSMGDFSKELCGGTHVKNTGNITTFKIVSEAGVAAGVRRIEALTGGGVFAYYKDVERTLAEAAKVAKSTPANLVDKIEHLLSEIKTLNSEIESMKSKAAKEALGDVMNQVKEVKGVKLLATSVEGVDMNGLRDLGDQLKEKLGEGVVVLASDLDGKVNLIAMVTEDVMKKGAHAGNLAREIAKTSSICQWNTDMYGVDPEKEGARAYYDSLFNLYAQWGVDFITTNILE